MKPRTLSLSAGMLLALILTLAGSAALALEGLSSSPPPLLPRGLLPAVPPPPRSFLLPEQAFQLQVVPPAPGADQVQVRFIPAPGYYLYRDRIRIQTASAPGINLSLAFPAAESKQDPSFGQVWVYHRPFAVQARVAEPDPAGLAVSYQGCAERGICYPPTTLHFQRTGAGIYLPLDTASGTVLDQRAVASSSNPASIAAWLGTARPAWVLVSFFGFGLLLAFTPCLFPMIPILSGLIVGQGPGLTRGRSFRLSLSYVVGMALTYALAGVAAGLTGTLLSSALQTPPVQIATALLFVVLALSMFGLYELQLPLAWQQRLQLASNRLPAGQHLGAALMGALSALVMGPCVAAPLAGGLLYIAQTHDVWLGGGALFVMALGMGLPLLAIGVSAGALLPRAGSWMVWVKRGFGAIMLGVALWVTWPLIDPPGAPPPGVTVVHDLQGLDAALGRARTSGQPLLVDFYAEWCVSCVEMERQVLARPEVRTRLAQGVWVRADVTANTPQEQALLARYGLFGPPALLFYDRNGLEIGAARLAGYVSASDFINHLQQYFH